MCVCMCVCVCVCVCVCLFLHVFCAVCGVCLDRWGYSNAEVVLEEQDLTTFALFLAVTHTHTHTHIMDIGFTGALLSQSMTQTIHQGPR